MILGRLWMKGRRGELMESILVDVGSKRSYLDEFETDMGAYGWRHEGINMGTQKKVRWSSFLFSSPARRFVLDAGVDL